MILETIKAICERENQKIFLLAPNIRKSIVVRAKLKHKTSRTLKYIIIDLIKS